MRSLSFFRLADGSLRSEPEKRLSLAEILIFDHVSGRSSLLVASAWLPSTLTPSHHPLGCAQCDSSTRIRQSACACVRVYVCAVSSMLVARCDRMAVAWKAEERPWTKSVSLDASTSRRLTQEARAPPRPVEGRSSHSPPRCYYVYPVHPLFSVSRHVHVQLPETYSSRIDTRCVDGGSPRWTCPRLDPSRVDSR